LSLLPASFLPHCTSKQAFVPASNWKLHGPSPTRASRAASTQAQASACGVGAVSDEHDKGGEEVKSSSRLSRRKARPTAVGSVGFCSALERHVGDLPLPLNSEPLPPLSCAKLLAPQHQSPTPPWRTLLVMRMRIWRNTELTPNFPICLGSRPPRHHPERAWHPKMARGAGSHPDHHLGQGGRELDLRQGAR
jgi:hypothetical protein